MPTDQDVVNKSDLLRAKADEYQAIADAFRMAGEFLAISVAPLLKQIADRDALIAQQQIAPAPVTEVKTP